MLNHKHPATPHIIAGPCAFESRKQLKTCVLGLKKLGVACVRASLWKPRTLPGWEGMGALSLEALLEETISRGVIPATEILTSDHAQLITEALRVYGEDAQMLVWLGSRNQNHIEQRRIAQMLAMGPKGIHLMFKNQMWEDEKHWLGIYEHLVAAGFPKERLSICHRGFSPGRLPNPHQYRNLPHYEMAMRVKERTGVPMILDPSHIGGSKENVLRVIEESKPYNFDGYMIEVHGNPKAAKTDPIQQLTIDQFRNLFQEKRVA